MARIRVVLAVLLLAVLGGVAWGGSAAAAASVAVTVNGADAGTVSSGFAGFSYEKNMVGAGLFDAHNTNLVRLFRLLGPSVLRVGGNTDDVVRWNAKGKGGSVNSIAPSDVTKLAGFLRATGWRVIYGINLKTNTAADAAAEARYAAKALGSSLLAFEIGNEPNVYLSSESSYRSDFDSYVKAIRATVPHATFAGPGPYEHSDWEGPFAAQEKNNGLVVLSMHTYIGDRTGATVNGMLTDTGAKFAGEEKTLEQATKADGIAQWRFTEANSYFHGGAPGVSNTEAAALWSLEFMHGVAANGGGGVNFHGGVWPQSRTTLPYSPIAYSGLTPTGVQGIYYGELLWTMAGTGPLHAATVKGGSGVTAWGIGHNVIVDNKGSAALTVTVRLSATAHTAHEYVLTASTPSSHATTIAGAGVAAGGAFAPEPRSVTPSGTTVVISVPADSAALVTTS